MRGRNDPTRRRSASRSVRYCSTSPVGAGVTQPTRRGYLGKPSRHRLGRKGSWVHFLRDVHTLMKEFPHDQALLTWAKAIYDVAVVLAAQEPDQRRTPSEQQQARVAQQRAFEQQLWTEAPQQTSARELSGSCQNCSFLSRSLGSCTQQSGGTQRTPAFRLPARSAAALVPPKDLRRAWG